MDHSGRHRSRRCHRQRVTAASVAALLIGGTIAACDGTWKPSSDGLDAGSAKQLHVKVIAEHPWDAASFTQGVEATRNGDLVVGTGQYGSSRIYKTTVDGKQSQEQRLAPQLFGEGITIHGDTVWQLTWKSGVAIRRHLSDLSVDTNGSDRGGDHRDGEYRYQGEGWGLCSNGTELVMSDGSGTLTMRDPQTFEERRRVEVKSGGESLNYLNELECTPDGSVWANVWQSDKIVRIDSKTGEVQAVVDTEGQFPAAKRGHADVLNGIAAVPGTNRFYLTGKYWDTMYEVEFEE